MAGRTTAAARTGEHDAKSYPRLGGNCGHHARQRPIPPGTIRPAYDEWALQCAWFALIGKSVVLEKTFYLCNAGLPLRRSIGTATGVILPISTGAIIGFGITAGWPHGWRWGYIDLHALLVLSIASIIASRWGVRAAAAIPVARLRKLFGVFMLGLSVKTLLSVFA